jgi:hypothetical protein
MRVLSVLYLGLLGIRFGEGLELLKATYVPEAPMLAWTIAYAFIFYDTFPWVCGGQFKGYCSLCIAIEECLLLPLSLQVAYLVASYTGWAQLDFGFRFVVSSAVVLSLQLAIAASSHFLRHELCKP